MKIPILAALPLLVAGPARAQFPFGFDGCEHREERSAAVSASGADLIRIAARAGSLRIEGRPGLSEVRVRGEACSSQERYLEQIELRAERVGDEVRIEAVIPEMRGFGNMQARLDLVVEVPESLALDVDDSSGGVEIRRVAALRLRDSSGEIDVSDVRGEVEIEDSSGEILLRGVGGNVRLSDSSGEIDVRDVAGSVLVESDGSGEIEIAEVERDVRIQRDGSGSISVSDVRGDFVVERDGSGRVRHEGVGGTVRVPSRRR
jgi:hypothetical protein